MVIKISFLLLFCVWCEWLCRARRPSVVRLFAQETLRAPHKTRVAQIERKAKERYAAEVEILVVLFYIVLYSPLIIDTLCIQAAIEYSYIHFILVVLLLASLP